MEFTLRPTRGEAPMTSRSHHALKDRLRGVLAFPISPFAADGSVDVPAVRRNAAWLPETGIAAVVAPSGTGEFFALTADEALVIMRTTVEVIAGRVPVIGSVGLGARV